MTKAWVFSLKHWTEITDPLPDGPLEEALGQLGYTTTPEAVWQSGSTSLCVELYAADPAAARPAARPLLVCIRTANRAWPIYVEDLPAGLELLGRLLPLVPASRCGPAGDRGG